MSIKWDSNIKLYQKNVDEGMSCRIVSHEHCFRFRREPFFLVSFHTKKQGFSPAADLNRYNVASGKVYPLQIQSTQTQEVFS